MPIYGACDSFFLILPTRDPLSVSFPTRDPNLALHWSKKGAKYRVTWQNESKISTMSEQNFAAKYRSFPGQIGLCLAQITWSPRQQATTFTPRFNSSSTRVTGLHPKKVKQASKLYPFTSSRHCRRSWASCCSMFRSSPVSTIGRYYFSALSVRGSVVLGRPLIGDSHTRVKPRLWESCYGNYGTGGKEESVGKKLAKPWPWASGRLSREKVHGYSTHMRRSCLWRELWTLVVRVHRNPHFQAVRSHPLQTMDPRIAHCECET